MFAKKKGRTNAVNNVQYVHVDDNIAACPFAAHKINFFPQ